MVANKAKKSRTAAARDADQFVGEVLVAVEKLKELQKELEKVVPLKITLPFIPFYVSSCFIVGSCFVISL